MLSLFVCIQEHIDSLHYCEARLVDAWVLIERLWRFSARHCALPHESSLVFLLLVLR